MWQITAQVERTVTVNGAPWSSSRQLPTFYLDGTVQGITSAEHAERIAQSVLNPFSEPITVHAHALWVPATV